jgi:CheY-like chemotaxis protein
MAFRLLPHIIVMDVKMPRISGVEATRRIKRFSSRRPHHWNLDAG